MINVLVTHDGKSTIVQMNGRVYRTRGDVSVRELETWISGKIKEGRK